MTSRGLPPFRSRDRGRRTSTMLKVIAWKSCFRVNSPLANFTAHVQGWGEIPDNRASTRTRKLHNHPGGTARHFAKARLVFPNAFNKHKDVRRTFAGVDRVHTTGQRSQLRALIMSVHSRSIHNNLESVVKMHISHQCLEALSQIRHMCMNNLASRRKMVQQKLRKEVKLHVQSLDSRSWRWIRLQNRTDKAPRNSKRPNKSNLPHEVEALVRHMTRSHYSSSPC